MMIKTPTVYLFDIDGTLITSGGSGRRAIIHSFEKALDRGGVALSFSFAGMTDRMIVRQGLAELGLPISEDAIDTILSDYLTTLEQEIRESDRYGLHPGVRAALDSLVNQENVALGLGTGNVEAGARIKLEPVNLNHYFDFGGFGCDAEAREALILRGAERGAEKLGLAREDCRVVVIGDTPRDIHAARAIGAQCIAVSTGGATAEELAANDPDWLFSDLTADGVLEALWGI